MARIPAAAAISFNSLGNQTLMLNVGLKPWAVEVMEQFFGILRKLVEVHMLTGEDAVRMAQCFARWVLDF